MVHNNVDISNSTNSNNDERKVSDHTTKSMFEKEYELQTIKLQLKVLHNLTFYVEFSRTFVRNFCQIPTYFK